MKRHRAWGWVMGLCTAACVQAQTVSSPSAPTVLAQRADTVPSDEPTGTLQLDPRQHPPLRVSIESPSANDLILRFSSPMVKNTEAPTPKLYFEPNVAGKWSWVDSTKLSFTADAPLTAATTRLVVARPLVALDGSRPNQPIEFEWPSTPEGEGIIADEPDEGELPPLWCWSLVDEAVSDDAPKRLQSNATPAQGSCNLLTGIQFGLPLDTDALVDLVQITPKVDGLRAESGSLRANFVPGIRYEITVPHRDASGNPLSAGEFALEAPLTGQFTFGILPEIAWAPGTLVLPSELDRKLRVLARGAKKVTTRSRKLSPEQALQLELARGKENAASERGLPSFGPPREQLLNGATQAWLNGSVREIVGSSSLGAYEVEVALDTTDGRQLVERKVINVTELSAVVALYGNIVQVEARSSGKLLAGASVTLQPFRATAQAKAVLTDAKGMARVALDSNSKPQRYMALIRHGADFTYTTGDAYSPERHVFVATQRGRYRPGETVVATGFVHLREAAGWRPEANALYRATLQLEGEATIFAQSLVTTSRFGGFHAELRLPTSATLGQYQLRLSRAGGQGTAANHDKVADDGNETAEQTLGPFAVFEVYEPEVRDMQLHVAFDKRQVVAGEPIRCDVSVRGPHGETLGGTKVHVFIDGRHRRTYGFELNDAYSVMNGPDLGLRGTPSVDGQLDENGRFSASYVPPADAGHYDLQCNASLTGPHAEPYSASAKARLQPRMLIGLEAGPWRRGAAYNPLLLVTDAQGLALPLDPPTTVLLRTTVSDPKQDGAKQTAVRKEQRIALTSNPMRVNIPSSKTAGMQIELEIEVQRASARAALGLERWSIPSAEERAQMRSRDQQLEIHPARPTVAAGEPIVVTITDPQLQSGPGTLQLFGGALLFEQAFTLHNHRATVRVPSTQAMVPWMQLVANIADSPRRRVAQHVSVTSSAHDLQLVVHVPDGFVTPNQKVTLELQTQVEGRAELAEVALLLVPEGDFLAFPTLEVTALRSARHSYPARTNPVRWDFEPSVPNSTGSRRWNSRSSTDAPEKLPRAPQVLARVVTDVLGKASVQVTLPDQLGDYRVVALGSSASGAVGSANAKLSVAKPVAVSGNLPPSLWLGDSLSAGVSLSKRGASTLSVVVQQQVVHGKTILRNETTWLRLNDHAVKEALLSWQPGVPGDISLETWLAVYDARALEGALGAKPTEVELQRWARGQGSITPLQQEVIEQHAKVKAKTHSLALGTSGALPGKTQVHLDGLTRAQRASGTLTLDVAAEPLATLRALFEPSTTSEHPTTDALASKLVRAGLPTLRQINGLPKTVNLAPSTPEVLPSLHALLDLQDRGGGFSLWPSLPSDPALSAQVALVLAQLQRTGVALPKAQRDALRGFLLDRADDTQLDSTTTLVTERRLGLEAAALSYFAAQALGSVPQADAALEARVSRKLERHQRKLSGLTLGLLGAARAGASSEQRTASKAVILGALRPHGRYLLASTPQPNGPFINQTQATAAALLALCHLASNEPQLNQLALGLLALRSGSGWATASDNNWALLALEAYAAQRQNSPSTLSVALQNGDQQLDVARSDAGQPARLTLPMSKLDAAKPDTALELLAVDPLTKAKVRAHFAAELSAQSDGFAPKQDQGLSVSLAFESPNVHAPGSHLSVDALGIMHVEITSASERKFVVVDVPLPAGVSPRFGSPWFGANGWSVSHYTVYDHGVRFYIEDLPARPVEIRFDLFGVTPGRFQVAPARAYELYNPTLFGTSDPYWYVVAPFDSPSERRAEDDVRQLYGDEEDIDYSCGS